MKTIAEYTGLKIPSYALSYLVNLVNSHTQHNDEGAGMTTQEKIDKYGEYEEGVPNLSPAQIERQDFVDNLTHTFINELIPHPSLDGTETISWDMEYIHKVWEEVQDILVKRGICTEMEFYPYIETDGE